MSARISRSTRLARWARLVPLVLFVLLLSPQEWGAGTAEAQIFRPARTLGQPLARRPGPGAQTNAEQTGTIQGNERFLRENRSREDFVGSDRREQSGFVGAEQAIGTGRVRSAIESLREFRDRSASINEPLQPPPADEMYYPRLQIDFSVPQVAPSQMSLDVQRRLNHLVEARVGRPIEVSVVDRQAILRGVVPSEEMAAQLEILASFEPGIDAVRNELEIASSNGPSEVIPPQLPPPPSIRAQDGS